MTGNADEPEWKCEDRNATWFWGEFHNWPVGCQRRHWSEMTVTQELPSPDKPENPQAILKPVDSPLPAGYNPDKGASCAAKAARSFALSSSAKGDAESDQPGIAGGPCTVTVKAPPENPDWDHFDASTSGGDERLKTLTDAIGRVREIVGGKNPCADFFENKVAALNALDAFEDKARIGVVDSSINTKTGIEMTSDKKNPTIPFHTDGYPYDVGTMWAQGPAGYRVFGRITVNINGPFFNKLSNARIGRYDDGYRRSQVLQILHELAHMVLDGKGHPLIVNDGAKDSFGMTVSSEDNTEKVKKACLTEIEASGER